MPLREKRDALDGLRTDSLKAIIMYLTRDWSYEQVEELIESSRWPGYL